MKSNYSNLEQDIECLARNINKQSNVSVEEKVELIKHLKRLNKLVQRENPMMVRVELYDKVCPSCGKILGEYYTGNRCEECGQVLDYE